MGDKWRFDPRQDYTRDDEDNGNGRGNFQRFKKHNKKGHDDDFYGEGKKSKRPKPNSKNWR